MGKNVMKTYKAKELLDAIQHVRNLLAAIEWPEGGDPDQTTWSICPICHLADWKGHSDNCQWVKVINELDEILEKHNNIS